MFIRNKFCRLAELSAYYDFNGYHFGSYLDINHFMPRSKILTLTKQVFPEAATQVLVQKARARKNQVCTVRVLTKQAAEEFYQALRDQDYLDDGKKVLAKNCCQRAYVRGAFLSHGSVTNPERTYHLEIFTEKSEVAERVL